MENKTPPTYEELLKSNNVLRATVARLRRQSKRQSEYIKQFQERDEAAKKAKKPRYKNNRGQRR